MTATYDAIVVGGGHNGLVAAAYLARSGARTVVLEGRYKTGGAATTEAPWPDAPEFSVTRLPYVMSLMPPTTMASYVAAMSPPPRVACPAAPVDSAAMKVD